jgi:hypothetical protein
MSGWQAEMLPHADRGTSSELPSDPLNVTVPVERSMFVTLCTGRRLENASGFVWMVIARFYALF